MKSIMIDKKRVDPQLCVFGFPWMYDCLSLNFMWPDTALTVDEVDNIEDKEDIEALIITCNLSDYTFIEGMTNLKQLYIYKARNIYDLGFLSNLTSLQQLYITNSSINSLDRLVELIKRQRTINDDNYNFIGFNGICIDSEYDLDIVPLIEYGIDILEVSINRHNLSKMIA